MSDIYTHSKRIVRWVIGNTPSSRGVWEEVSRLFPVFLSNVSKYLPFNEVFNVVEYSPEKTSFIKELSYRECSLVHVWFEKVPLVNKNCLWIYTPLDKIEIYNSPKVYYLSLAQKSIAKLRYMGIPPWRIWYVPFDHYSSEKNIETIIERLIAIYSYLLTLREMEII